MAQLADMSTDAFEDFYFDVCCLDYARMSKAMAATWVVSGITAYVAVEREQYADLAAGLWAVAAAVQAQRVTG